MQIKKISISARLILVMSLIAVLTAGLSAYLIMRFIESGEQVKVLAEEGTQGIIWGERANFYLHNLIINFYRANSGDMKYVQAMEDNIPNIRAALNEYAKTAKESRNLELLTETRAALDDYAVDIKVLGESFRQGIHGPDIIDVLNRQNTKPHADRLISAVKNLVEYSKTMAENNRASFFSDMAANTKASIILACVVVCILILAGYTGVIWTRDEIAEHNTKENQLKKLREDLLNSLEAAGAISRQLSFVSGEFTFVGDIEKVLHKSHEEINNLTKYAHIIYSDDHRTIMGKTPWSNLPKYSDYEAFLRDHPEEFIVVDNRPLLSPESSYVKTWLQKAGSTTATLQREYRCLAPGPQGDEWRWKRSLSKLIPDPSGLGFSGENGILFDITSEYQIKTELMQSKYDAEAASRAKSDFLARMSHEIRTPMNAIIGMTHLTLRTQLNDIQREYQGKVLSSAENLLKIINDILDFSKIEAGKMELEASPFRLDDVLSSVADIVHLNSRTKQLELIFSISQTTPEWLCGDSLRLSQVLINLANNAVKFTSEGEILIAVNVVEQTEKIVKLLFSVTDTGIGMTPEQIQNLFQSFTQANGSITRKFGGTGLGLAISKSLVEAMGGSIWAESTPGQGSTFSFTTQMEIATDQEPLLRLPQDLRNLRTLIIDDNDHARHSLAAIVSSIFVTKADTAPSCHEALRLISPPHDRNIPYDLIFVDYEMPQIDGIETARQLKTKFLEHPTQPFIILLVNNCGIDTIRAEAHLAGVDGFLTKPNCPSTVFDAVATLFDRKSSLQTSTSIRVKQEQLDKVVGMRVLVVDDNLFNQEIAKEFLTQAGMAVDIAGNGFAALEAVENTNYDLVFMDIQMPDLDGLEVAQRIRAKFSASALPIIAITAHAMAGDREKSLAAGMNDHITKPIDPNELMSMLVKWGTPHGDVEGGKNSPPVPLLNREVTTGKGYPFKQIDQAAGLRRCLDKAESYQRFLAIFYQEYHELGERCDSLMAEQNIEKVRHLAHAIRGPAGSIGAIKLQAAAQALEQAIWRREKATYEELYSLFRNNLNAVLQELQPVVAAVPVEPDSHEAEVPLTAIELHQVVSLRAKLLQNDISAANQLKELGPFPKGSPWAILQTQIEHFDFELALTTLDQIAADLKIESCEHG